MSPLQGSVIESSSHKPHHKPSQAEKIFAGLFSYLFHPLFIPVYVIIFLTYIHPSAFTGFSEQGKNQSIIIILLNIVFFPLFSVILLKFLGFIDSIYLRTKKDRIIPYMACGIFFFWAYTVFREQLHYPLLLTSFILGIFLASSAGLIANIYYKISMHAIGVGGAVAFMVLLGVNTFEPMGVPISIATFVAGLVCTARLVISDHDPMEIVWGFSVGVVCQLIACWIIM